MQSNSFNTHGYVLSLSSISQYIQTDDTEKGNESGFAIDLQIALQASGIQWKTTADRHFSLAFIRHSAWYVSKTVPWGWPCLSARELAGKES